MLIDQGKLDVANTTVLQKFTDLFLAGNGADSQMDLFLDTIPASSINTEIPFAAPTGTWAEWVSSKVVSSLKAYKQSIPFRRYHYTVSLDRKDVAYDQSGAIGKNVAGQMAKAQAQRSKIVFDEMFLASGTGPLGYDGVRWLASTHAMAYGGNQNNITAAPLTYNGFDVAFQTMTSLLGHDGQPLGIVPDLLVVGPKYRKIALDIAGPHVPMGVNNANSWLAPGATLTTVGGAVIPNAYQGSIKVVISNRLVGTQDDYAYLMCTSLADKPFLLVQQRAPELVTMFDMNNPQRFYEDQFSWSVEADCSPACGFPLLTHGFIS